MVSVFNANLPCLKEYDPERVDVDLLGIVPGAAGVDLGRHVQRSADLARQVALLKGKVVYITTKKCRLKEHQHYFWNVKFTELT